MIRILPPSKNPEGFYGYKLFVHNVNKTNILCPRVMSEAHPELKIAGTSCPICDRRAELESQNVSWEEGVKNYNLDVRWLLFVINMESQSTASQGILAFSAPKTLLRAIKEACQNPRNTNEYIDVSDVKEGKVVIFKRDDTGPVTKYAVTQMEPSPELPVEYTKAPDFVEVLSFLPYDEVQSLIGGKRDSVREPAQHEQKKFSFSFSGKKAEPVGTPADTDDEEVEEMEEMVPDAKEEKPVEKKEESIAEKARAFMFKDKGKKK